MELDDQLQKLATEVPPPPAPDATAAFRRGTRRRRRRYAGGVATAISVVAVVGLGVISLLDPQSRPPEVADQPELPGDRSSEGETSTADSRNVCPAPDLQPTYLPWLDAGESVPAPTDAHDGTGDEPHGRLVWADDASAYDPTAYSATDVVAVASLAYHELSEFPEAEVRGHPAELVWIGSGDLSLTWSEGPAACETYAIFLTFAVDDGPPEYLGLESSDEDSDDLTAVEAAIEVEAMRIADSLVDASAPTE